MGPEKRLGPFSIGVTLLSWSYSGQEGKEGRALNRALDSVWGKTKTAGSPTSIFLEIHGVVKCPILRKSSALKTLTLFTAGPGPRVTIA